MPPRPSGRASDRMAAYFELISDYFMKFGCDKNTSTINDLIRTTLWIIIKEDIIKLIQIVITRLNKT